jgi:predicted dithiol-disulfide oxidoreductase (DUF899 family)
MSLPEVTSREQWLVARRELLAKEKAHTRQRDALNAQRRRLPMVAVTEDYRFEGPAGQVGLLDLFDGRGQLVLQHVMFDPAWDDVCGGCAAGFDEMADGTFTHLRSRDTAFAAVSRAPFAKLAAAKARRGWGFAWYSSAGSDFNYDYNVTLDQSVAPIEYNYRNTADTDLVLGERSTEVSGISCFLRDGDRVFHTYSTYSRGTDQMVNAYNLLDLTALGRHEDWEEPKGRVTHPHGPDPTFSG